MGGTTRDQGRRGGDAPGRRLRPWLRRARALALAACLLYGPQTRGGEVNLTEYQVKSLFLMNFAKYVDWPPGAFGGQDAPFVIGLYGEHRFGDALTKAVGGRLVAGRPITVLALETAREAQVYHILFISGSEKPRAGEILERFKARPVLTVGETDQFLAQGGVINFVKKDGKVRLEINLAAARQAKLEISSKLLNVADVVQGKLN